MIKSLRFYTFQSLAGHVALVLVFMLLTYLFWGNVFKLRNENLKLISASVRVDVVALPDKTLKELKSLQQLQASIPAAPVVAPSPTPITKPKVDDSKSQGEDFKKQNEKASLSDMLKKYSKNKVKTTKKTKTKAKKNNTNDNALKAKDLERLRGLVSKGNKVRSGVALTGEASEAVLSAFEEYVVKLPEILRPFWILPSYLADKGLRCRIQVFISKEGKVLRKVIFQSSGEDEFDKRALATIDKAAPFPKPTAIIHKKLASGEITLGFPL